jgi:hypothetical protein
VVDDRQVGEAGVVVHCIDKNGHPSDDCKFILNYFMTDTIH